MPAIAAETMNGTEPTSTSSTHTFYDYLTRSVSTARQMLPEAVVARVDRIAERAADVYAHPRQTVEQTIGAALLMAEGVAQKSLTIAEDVAVKTYRFGQPYAEPVVERVKPMVDTTIEKVKPYAEPIVEKVKPYADPIVEKMKPYTTPIVGEVTKVVERVQHRAAFGNTAPGMTEVDTSVAVN